MTNAATGNPVIPSHPSISASHAQAMTPPASNGATPPASAAPQGGPQSMDMDWASLAMGMEDEPGAPPLTNPQTQQQAPNGQQPQGQPPATAPQQPTPEQMEAIARANQEAQVRPQQQQPQGQQMTPEQATAKAVEHLLNTEYKLTDEQARELVSKPDVAIPQLAARMHVQIATQLATYMHQAIQQMVPNMAVAAMQKQMGAFKAEQAFFGKYPALANPQFRGVVLQSLKLAKMYDPNATRDKVMQDAAELAAFKLKVSLQPQQQQQQQAPRQPHTPAQVPAPQAQMPFMPAPPGGAPASTAQPGQQQPNIFAELAGENDW